MSAVKIVYQGDIRRVSLPEEEPFAFLEKEVIRIFEGEFKHGIVIRYVDDEEDLVTITTDMELLEAVNSTEGTLKLRISACNPDDSEGEFVKVSKDGRSVILSKQAEKKSEVEKKPSMEKKAKAAAKADDATPLEKESKVTEDLKSEVKLPEKEKVCEKKSYSVSFVTDVTIPDNSEHPCGSLITKTWRVKNTGNLAWPTGVYLIWTETKFEVEDEIPVPALAPGKEGDVSIVLRVPAKAGTHQSQSFKLSSEGNTFEGDQLWALVKAKARKAPVQPEKKAVIEKKVQLKAKFVEDVTIPDGMKVEAGAQVVKQWLIENNGATKWPEGTVLVKLQDSRQFELDYKVPLLAPGEKGIISVTMTAPKKRGIFKSRNYSLAHEGKVFGDNYWAQLNVTKPFSEARKLKEAAKAEKKAARAAKKLEKQVRKERKSFCKKLNAKFIEDVTIPDGFEAVPGQVLTKTWKIKNDGQVAWPEGTRMVNWMGKGNNQPVDCKVPLLKPGECGLLTVSYTVPEKTGKVKSTHYSLEFAGTKFGDHYWILLKVKGKTMRKESKKIFGAQFVKDVNIPDGTIVAPGQQLVKSWILKNSGNCTIPAGFKFVCLKKASTFGKDAETEISQDVKSGDHFAVTVKLAAPTVPGEYSAQFRMESADGKRFGHKYWVNVRVSAFPAPADFKAMAMNFLADRKVVEVLQAELPYIIMEIRQGKKISTIIEALLAKYPMFEKHVFIIFLKPYLKSAESFMGDQLSALMKMYSLMPLMKQ
mmetsp:Transcript_11976/g.17853  ORF Transcript_11976/g.17853 Transcript_11976/m.17853 type:complete len:759 (+) Transcript_11976:84-2360(+)|eukprot:CAMPEP_0167752566 /NCGR_PEP_ID=MMETSP0110_2-20121227/7213_1 /TAXON_ID=629695 /ORGANISM="Gymnochlora sp., Strain CCMP2014" /LENGTH=758 /DNA_ID=CAMNT_0007638203 /DNA_START=54 /DNA_END=2330 /DNA_ORIENTATION=+